MRRGGSTVLVTGASTGLGLALARRLIRDTDHQVVLTARAGSLPRFEAAGVCDGDRCAVRALDVTLAADRRRVIEECNDRWGGVDVLVNNAGVAFRSVLEHVTEAAFLRSIRGSLLAGARVNLQDVMRLDERIAAHLDGVAIAAECGAQLAEEALASPGGGEIFVAAIGALSRREPPQIYKLCSLVEAVPDERA